MTKTFNTSGLTEAEIEKLPKLGEFRNNWRQRHVTLYAHPHLSEAVVSVGVGFVVSALMSWALSQRMGLLATPAAKAE